MSYGTDTEERTDTPQTDEQKKISKILRCFRRAYQNKKDLLTEMEQDFEFYLGWQWDEESVKKLEERGVKPLTINKIHPIIQLILGIESQNRTDPHVYPEGAEDGILADIATRLIKNMYKRSQVNYKVSEMFEDGLACGEGWLEPFLEYTNSLHLGELRWKKTNAWNVLVDPSSIEYDLSDAEYVDKVTYDLSADQLRQLFPDKEKEIEDLSSGKKGAGKLTLEEGSTEKDSFGAEIQRREYDADDDEDVSDSDTYEPTFDLLEHYYKKYVEKYFVLDFKRGDYRLVEDKAKADAFVNKATEQDPPDQKSAKVIRRYIPEMWVCSTVGQSNSLFYEGPAWSYPNWKLYCLIPFWCYRSTIPLKKMVRHLRIQGITRGIKDLNFELNKRRTQELLHLNSSANSGWLSEKGAWVDKERVKKFGASPGATLEYKQGTAKPERIFPMPLSQGHAQLSQQAAEDLKSSSGINADLLAQEGGQDSGRAIYLRQKQGLVQIQIIFDHLNRTKNILAKFHLSQLGEMYDVEESMRVLGDAFIQQNFSEPVLTPPDPITGVQMPQIDPRTGQVATQVNVQKAQQTINKVLSDAELGKFDVEVGQAVSSETVKYANYLMLTEMSQSGIPVPPEVIIDESTLPEASKQKIKEAFMRQQQAQLNTPTKPTAKEK